MNAIFDFKRIGLLMQRYYLERFQGELMFWGVSIICMMFFRNSVDGVLGFAIVVAIIRNASFFREIHSPTNRINYFMIPATQIEKFVASLFYTIIYFWCMVFVVYIIGNILGTWANNLLANTGLLSNILGFRHQDLNWVVFDFIKIAGVGDTLVSFVGILIIQFVFLLGSIYFKKNQLVKTILALVIIGLFFALISGFAAKQFLADNTEMLASGFNLKLLLKAPIMKSMGIILNIFFYLLTPYLWLVSYIRLTEKEV
jgi:hypothetical protein